MRNPRKLSVWRRYASFFRSLAPPARGRRATRPRSRRPCTLEVLEDRCVLSSNFGEPAIPVQQPEGVQPATVYPPDGLTHVRVVAVRLTNDTGTLEVGSITPERVTGIVNLANKIYADDGVTVKFEFNPAKDFVTYPSTFINNLSQGSANDPYNDQRDRAATALAADYPDAIVLFFRYGMEVDASGVRIAWDGQSYSGGDRNNVILQNYAGVNMPDTTLAHELGHYFTLPHTFTNAFDTSAQIQDAYNTARSEHNIDDTTAAGRQEVLKWAFDGDVNDSLGVWDKQEGGAALLDTIPDPFNREDNGKRDGSGNLIQSIQLEDSNHVKFTVSLPRQYLMSYWDSGGTQKLLTADEVRRVNAELSVAAKYDSLSGWMGPLGLPVGAEGDVFDAQGRWVGRYRDYEGGSIYWGPQFKAHEIHGPIQDKWLGLGGADGVLGLPVSDVRATDDGSPPRGYYTDFRWNGGKGAIYQKSGATTAFALWGPIYDKWAELGWENGILHFPTSDQAAADLGGGGAYVTFEGSNANGGAIYYSDATGAHEVHGLIYQRWIASPATKSQLGYPTSDEVSARYMGRDGKVSYFQRGAIFYYHDDYGDHTVVWPDVGDTMYDAEITDLNCTPATYSNTNHLGLYSPYGDKDVDFYRVSAATGSRLTASTHLPAGVSPLYTVNTVLRVFDQNGNEVATSPDTGGSPDTSLTFTIPDTGLYYVGVSGYDNHAYDPDRAGSGTSGAVGIYQVDLTLSDPGEAAGSTLSTAAATNMAAVPTDGNPVHKQYATWEALGNGPYGTKDVDMYHFRAVGNSVITAAVTNTNVPWDAVLRLFDSQGHELAFLDRGFTPATTQLTYTIPLTGDYYLGVSGVTPYSTKVTGDLAITVSNRFYDPFVGGSGFDGAVTDYNLSLDVNGVGSDAGDTRATAFDLTPYPSIPAIVESLGNGPYGLNDVDMYKISVSAGDVVEATTQAAQWNGVDGRPVDTYLRLFDASGREVAVNDDDPSGGTHYSRLTYTAAKAGVYYLGVSQTANRSYNPDAGGSGVSSDYGDYTLTITRKSVPQGSDFGFELPALAAGTYQYQPTSGTPWTFGPGAGVAGNGSDFTRGNPPAPQGSQVAFLQGTGSVTQSLAFATAGQYVIQFSAAQRGNLPGSQTIQVQVDGAVVGTVTPTSTGYGTYGTAPFTVSSAGSHTVTFLGLNPNGGDNTAFIDRVAISPYTTPPTVDPDLGFELPGLAAGTFQYQPTFGTPWAFGPGAGVAGNGSGFTAGNPPAPQGSQVAFLQGAAATISQSLAFAAAGRYVITFQAAQRGNLPGSQTIQVQVDGAVVGTVTPTGTNYGPYGTDPFTVSGAGQHTVTFLGLNPNGGDNTAFIDRVVISPYTTPPTPDLGFELPGLAAGTFQYQPTFGTPWAFGPGAGVAGNGSGFTAGNPPAPQGSQVAFLQGAAATISQSLAFAVTGNYVLSVSAAQRGNNGLSNETFQVKVDGTVVGTFTPSGTSYATYTTTAFSVAAGNHTITFVGVDPSGADYTVFLDQVALLPAP